MERPVSKLTFGSNVSGYPGSASPASRAAVACGQKDRADSSEPQTASICSPSAPSY